MNLNKLITSKFLKQSDIDKPTIVTVKSIEVENVAPDNQEPEEKGVMYFDELDKGMVMNKTNLLRAQRALDSEETDDWIGHQLVLYVDEEVEFGGKQVGGLRLRAAKQQKPAKGKTMEDANKELRDMPDDVPF